MLGTMGLGAFQSADTGRRSLSAIKGARPMLGSGNLSHARLGLSKGSQQPGLTGHIHPLWRASPIRSR
jgi:hypothetical protein